MDFFIDNAVRNAIIRLIKDYDDLPDNVAIWKSLTRLMFQNYSASEINSWIEDISQEAYDKDWFEKKYSKEEFEEKFVKPQEKVGKLKKDRTEKSKSGKTLNSKISSKLSIIGLADEYGLKPLGKSKRVCPFHADSEPSLSLNDKMGLFHCFGCKAGGNMIKFNALLKKFGVEKCKK